MNIELTTPIQTPSHPITPHPQPPTVPVSKDGLERNSWTTTPNHESLCETAETEASLSVEHLNRSGYTYRLKKSFHFIAHIMCSITYLKCHILKETIPNRYDTPPKTMPMHPSTGFSTTLQHPPPLVHWECK